MSGVDLIEFLRARLGEDERRWRDIAAKAAADRGSFVVLSLAHPELAAGDCPSDLGEIDPARVLREVEAKWAIVDWLDQLDEYAAERNLWDLDTASPRKLIAAVWADHKDYQEEWRA